MKRNYVLFGVGLIVGNLFGVLLTDGSTFGYLINLGVILLGGISIVGSACGWLDES